MGSKVNAQQARKEITKIKLSPCFIHNGAKFYYIRPKSFDLDKKRLYYFQQLKESIFKHKGK